MGSSVLTNCQTPSFSIMENGLISLAMKMAMHLLISLALALVGPSGVANPLVSLVCPFSNFFSLEELTGELLLMKSGYMLHHIGCAVVILADCFLLSIIKTISRLIEL